MNEGGKAAWPRLTWGPLTALAALGAGIAFVNATSNLMEAARDHRTLDAWEPFVWEYSSWTLVLLLAPLVGRALTRWPRTGMPFWRFLLIHAALTFPFSATHVTGMWVLRKLAYWIAGGSYDFWHNQPLTIFLYEWRKDVTAYALIALIYYLFRRRAQASVAPPALERIELRERGSVAFLAPGDVLYVEAAGNYVEFHTATRSHLVRGTLASWEAQLTARGFARVHRSRLVNRARIAATKSTPSGDLEITLDGGKTIAGSRRFRSALEPASAVMSR